MNRSVEFFEQQFRRQVQEAAYALNPFEKAILPHLKGEVLDLGCGLGMLAMAAAQAGCTVTALDASPSGVADLARRAAAAGVKLDARAEDLRRFTPSREYDAIVAVGLLMFLPRTDAQGLLARIHDAVRPGGLAAINVLVEGTTYLDMFDPSGYYLFGRDELAAAFGGWEKLLSVHEDFPAPGNALKSFHTFIARRPS